MKCFRLNSIMLTKICSGSFNQWNAAPVMILARELTLHAGNYCVMEVFVGMEFFSILITIICAEIKMAMYIFKKFSTHATPSSRFLM